MLGLFFALKMKQGQREELVAGIFQQNVHFIAQASSHVQKSAPREKGQTVRDRSANTGWCTMRKGVHAIGWHVVTASVPSAVRSCRHHPGTKCHPGIKCSLSTI